MAPSPPRHFDRSAAEWRNLVPVGARFLHSAVLRTAPVEMTGLGAGLEGDLLAQYNLFLILSSGGAAYRRTHLSRGGVSN